MHGSGRRNSQYITTVMIQDVHFGTLQLPNVFPNARPARKMCPLALADAGIKRFSTVIQVFRLPISPHDQRRWRRDRWALCPGGRFRPKLLKEMRRVAWLAKCLQGAERALGRQTYEKLHVSWQNSSLEGDYACPRSLVHNRGV